MTTCFISSTDDNDEEHVIHLIGDNMEIMINVKQMKS